MSYRYETEKPKLLTDEGQQMVMKAWDNARVLLEKAGAFMSFSPLKNIHYGDSFTAMAILDRLVELKYIKEITGTQVAGQDRIFISTK